MRGAFLLYYSTYTLIMSRQKIRILIPLIIIAGLLLYTWIMILTTDSAAIIQHYIGLVLFIPLFFQFFKNLNRTIVWTGIYLLAGVVKFLAITPSLVGIAPGIGIGSLQLGMPSFQVIPFLIFILYAILNFDQLGEMYLDYKEAKEKKNKA